MFLRNIFEALARTGQGKTAVVGWGRGMGHKGHMMLASSVITQADKVGGDPYFVVSKTVGKDDPITPDEKIAIYKKVFPQSGHIFQPATDEIPDLTRVLANLNQQGYTSVTVVLGADQVKAFQYLKNYNNKPDKSGNILYNFDSLDVISRQETGDPSAGEEGPRATPMRQVLMDPTKSEQEQFAVWRDAMSPEVSDDEVRSLMMKAKERMSAFAAPKKKTKTVGEEAAGVGVIASKKQAKDPRYSMSLTKDVRPGQIKKNLKAFNLAEEPSNTAMAHTAKRLTDPKDGAVAKLRAAGDKRREDDLKSRNIAKKNEGFDSEYNDEAGMAQSNLRTMARAVDGLLKTIKNNDNLPEWGQEKIAKAEMMLVSVWDYLQSQKELGRDPKVNESVAVNKLRQIVAELSNEKLGQYKKAAGAQASAADKAGNTKKADKRFSGIVKATKKQFANDEKGVAERMLPKSAFAGSDKNKLGSAGQLKGSMKRPAKAGDLVGSAEESIENEAKQRLDPSCWKGYRKQGTKMKGDTRVNNCVKVSEDVENIIDSLVNKIITNEAIQNNRR
jgi:hypothetical protein